MPKKVSKIVITGGPCAGKTTGMNKIESAFTKRGYKVVFIPETATDLINSGVQPWSFTRDEFQVALTKYQLIKEKLYEETAKKSNFDKILLVCDRGVIDGKAFTKPELYKKIIQDTGFSEIELRDSYDAVFHMLTAAKGAEEFYTLENNAARTETAEQAREADDKLIQAWAGHPHFRIIDNSTGFEEKMNRLIAEIALSLGEPKPFEAKKKYLIEYPDLSLLEKLENVEKVELDQTYLKADNDEKIQIRKRGLGDDCIYYQTRVRIQNGQLLQVEKRLSKSEYEDKLTHADPTRKKLHRTRYCIVDNNQYMEIDIYPFWNDKAILNIDVLDVNSSVYIPDYVKVVEDITNNPQYFNSELSKL